MRFIDFGLAEPILRAIGNEGYEHPSPIQAGVIPPALKGRDILGTAQTGTGKTAAFALPIIHRLANSGTGRGPGTDKRSRKGPPRGRGRAARALVLCPTRELAAQIVESFQTYGKGLPISSTAIFGGVGQGRQVTAIRNGVDVLVATPGRLMDLMGQGHIDLQRIETLVLDEADRMLDMGFIHPIRRIVAELPEKRQTMLLSATISKEIRVLADDLLHRPQVIETAPESSTAELVDQRLYLVGKADKPTLLIRFFEHGDMARTLVFTRTKHGADRLTRVLKKARIKVEAIHGDKSQGQRTRAMDSFRSGRIEALVATDVAARGIDVDGVTHVVNYDMPVEPESYVHRIGRTARAGATGKAISLCDRHEIELLRAIEKRTDARPILGRDHDDLTYQMPADGGRAAAREMKEARAAAIKARSTRGGSSPKSGRTRKPGKSGGAGGRTEKDADATVERSDRSSSPRQARVRSSSDDRSDKVASSTSKPWKPKTKKKSKTAAESRTTNKTKSKKKNKAGQSKTISGKSPRKKSTSNPKAKRGKRAGSNHQSQGKKKSGSGPRSGPGRKSGGPRASKTSGRSR